MSIPAVNITVLDGGIGSVQPSNAKTHAKLGVCSLGTASVAASYLYPSTTMSDGVTFTAVTAGAAGNLITVDLHTPTGGSTTVSVVGTAITIIPKSGAVNSDIVTAVNASAAALLVTPVATGPSDVVNSTGVTHNLAGGISGTENTIIPLTSPGQCKTALGYGPLADACAYSLTNSAGLIYAVPVNPSVNGSLSGVSHVGSGSPAVTVASGGGTGPYDSYNAIITIVLGGALGVGTFTYSLDGGTTTSGVLAIPGGGSYTIPNSNIAVTFASGTYVAADTYNFSTVEPSYSTTDITNAFAALTANPNTWNFAHVVGVQASVTASATMATTVDGIMSAAATAYRYSWAMLECPSDTDANIISAFTSFVSNRTMVCASTATTKCPVSGLTIPRSSAWAIAARAALVSISTDLGQVNIGPLPQLTAIQRDENVTPALDALGFSTLRTFAGINGFFITGGHMFVAQTSDYFNVQNRRVMDAACTQTYASMLFFLNSALLVNKSNGTIAETSAQNIEGKAGGELNQAILAPGFCTSTSLVVDRSNNVLSTNTLNVTVAIVPLAYAKTINATLTFTNPGLQTVSTPL